MPRKRRETLLESLFLFKMQFKKGRQIAGVDLNFVILKRKIIRESAELAMSKICQITGKKAMVGNNVSHSKRRTKRKFDVNLFTKKFYWVEQDCWVSLNISAAGLRTINKLGLDAAIKKAAEKGYLNA